MEEICPHGKYETLTLSNDKSLILSNTTCPYCGKNEQKEYIIGKNICGIDGNCWWVLEDNESTEDTADFVLLVGGNGAMNNYKSNSMPWYEYKDSITALKLYEGLTTIGSNSFYAFNNIKGDLIIPETVSVIGQMAFRECTGIDGLVQIKGPVETLGYGLFYKCTGIERLEIAEGCKIIRGAKESGSLSRGTFQGCTNLKSINLPNSIEEIGYCAFANCSNIEWNIVLPNSLITIGDYAFSGCKKITGDLIISENIHKIGDYAFRGCENLNGKVNINGSVEKLGTGSFYGCKNITSLSIAEGCKIIRGAKESGSLPRGTFQGCTNLKSINLPNSIEEIGYYAFANCSNLEGNLVLPKNLTILGERAFSSCAKLLSIEFTSIPNNIETTTFQNCNAITKIETIWEEGKIENAPWGAIHADIIYR